MLPLQTPPSPEESFAATTPDIDVEPEPVRDSYPIDFLFASPTLSLAPTGE